MKRVLLLCIMVGFLSVQAESPTVPNNIEFAGLNLKLSDKARKKIQTEVDALTRSPKYFQVKVDRLQIYFPIIERIFREEGLPEDFKYLVLQESALISDAVSSSNAVGFWQFKTAAATEVGLRVDRNVDERLNIVASTRGAAKYIKKNNRLYFDNWVHALLAYQQGPGGAQRLVDKKFSGSRSMPIDGNTHWYVIKFLAHKVAFEQVRSGEPGLFLAEFYDGQGESLKEIAQQHSLDVELVKQYNKWLNQSKVPTDREYAVILPYAQQPRMLASSENSTNDVVNNTSGQARQGLKSGALGYSTHPTKYPVLTKYGRGNRGLKINGIKGVRLTKDMDLQSLEQTTGVTVKRLLYYNDVISNKKPRVGEFWYLKRKKSKAKEDYHIAETGEELWSISQKYGIRLSQLQRKNRISKAHHTVKAGRVLWLRETRPADVPAVFIEIQPVNTDGMGANTVRSTGDSEVLKTVSKPVDNTSGAAESAVPTKTSDTTKPPDTFSTEATGDTENSVITSEKVHEVQPGETLYSIARQYHTTIEELSDWNNLDGNSILSVGQQLKITEYNGGSIPDSSGETTTMGYVIYQVKQGDTLYHIARDHGTTIKELMALNGRSDFSLSIGEQLKVPKMP